MNPINRNFVRSVLSEGGTIKPLIISVVDSAGLGLCNPSVFIDRSEIWLILRNVNYTLYHCENEQTFNNRWGPLSYLNPEHDLHLRTTNFLCKLTPDLDIEKYWKIDTSALDKDPLWEFVGLEDARLVRWDGHLYGIGVRRDTTTIGQGRMELSELEMMDDGVKEINRYRVEHPTDPNWYCEKNWMPILDMPYHFIQWTNPAVVIKADLMTLKSARTIEVNETDKIEGLPFLRGSSQVIPWKNYYICIVHDCDLFKNKIGQKDATYMHRFVIYDRNWNIIKIGEQFSFMDGEIEFCCGMAIYKDDLLISFGFQDNCAFILRVPAPMIPKILGVDKPDWGQLANDPETAKFIEDEVLTRRVYEHQYVVKPNDVVMDVGASIGPFIWSISDKKAKRIIALEPDPKSLKTLRKNAAATNNVEIINKGISSMDGKFISKGLFSGRPFNESQWAWEGDPTEIDGIRFDTLVCERHIDHIDFLKTDCEGGEYDIFNDDNLPWITNSVLNVAGEFHLHNDELRIKWLHFRDTYLKALPKFTILALNDVDITWDVWNDHFVNYYGTVMVYIDNSVKRRKWQATQYPTLEITTAVPAKGCPLRCVFCPQDNLIGAYRGDQMMSYDNFVKVIDKLPQDIHISFAGYCEPYVNRRCTDMILYAHNTGHTVSLFTTGVGMSVDDFNRILHIPFTGVQGGFVLHLPDKEGYFKHHLSHKYLDLMWAIKLNQSRISNFQSATMGTLDDQLKEIFTDTFRQTMYTRAGNVERDDLVQIVSKAVPMTCGCPERLYHGVLLPNGDMTLCCMDYGLKHIHGNLLTQEYEEIIPEDRTAFLLCETCENGVKV
jgi:FkbM family methyltransferase